MAFFRSGIRVTAGLLLLAFVSTGQYTDFARLSERQQPDLRPALDGQRVRISGIIPTQPVRMPQYRLLAVQDNEGRGIFLEETENARFEGFEPGDRVEVEGTASSRAGLPVIRPELMLRISSGPPPEPQPMTISEATRFENLGRYVTIDATVTSTGANAGGDVLGISDHGQAIGVFLPRVPRDRRNEFADFAVGDRVRIQGLTSQYAPIPPHEGNFQLVVREASAVTLLSKAWFVPPVMIAVIFCALVALAGMWWWRERLMAAQRRVLRGIVTMSEDVLAASSAREIAQRVQRELPRVLPGARADLLLFKSSDETLVRVTTEANSHPMVIPIDAPIGTLNGAIALCLRNRALLRIPDTARSPILTREESNPPGGAILVPTWAQGELMGVLAVYTPKRLGRNADLDVALQHMGNQVAASLHLQEHQQIRDQLLRSEKMAATGQLISGLAKDLRAPLDNIGRAARQMAQGMSDVPGLGEISAEADRGLEMIDHLLSFSRMEQRDAKPLDINALVSSLIDLRREERDRKGLTCNNLLPVTPVRVLADRGQLEQALLTVLVHAEHAATQSPNRSFEVLGRVVGRKVLVSFESQRPTTTETVAPATLGDYFGFPVAQVIAQSHGGDLRSSRPGSVTRLELELPVYEDTIEAVAPVREGGAVRTLTCLLIEPDILSQRKIIAMLSARGHRGIPAATPEDAVDLVQRMQFDVIFCASRLQGLTWLEVYHRIRRRIGAFALLSDTWDAEAAQTLGHGEGKVLTRPVADRDLDDFLGFVEVRLAAARS